MAYAQVNRSFGNFEYACDVRFGSKADMCGATGHVRFTPDSDRESVFPQNVMSALPPIADIGQRLCGNPDAATLILGCSGSSSISNKFIQKGLASSCRQSGTVSSFGALAALRDPALPA
jgi:hypothetical protein